MSFYSLANKAKQLVMASPQLIKILKYSTSRSLIAPFSTLRQPTNKVLHNSHRFLSQEIKDHLTVDFDYVKKATNKNDILIIDVREPEEVKELGQIPNSINIPLGSVVAVLSTVTDKEFQEIFERQKPSDNTEMIFYCMIGKRSGKAQHEALNLGFKNAKNYLGSWTDWASKTK